MKLYDLPIQPSTAGSTLPSFKFQCDLDGQTYGLQFVWNERFGAWFMSIFDVNDNPLICGVRVVVDFPLAFRSTLAGLFPGMLIALDTSGQHIDPGLNDFGTRVLLQYIATGSDG